MKDIILKKYNLFDFVGNLKSESIGFYFSFFFHFIILLIAIGLPNFFDPKPISISTVIPIEIINVAEITSITKDITEEQSEVLDKKIVEEKKFNNSNIQEIKKIELKETSEIKTKKIENFITPKTNVVIQEKNETTIKLEKKKKILVENIAETLPTKKIRPKLKPKPEISTEEKESDTVIKVQPKPEISTEEKESDTVIKVQPKPIPEFSIASMLRDLRNEKTSQNIDSKIKEKKIEITDKSSEKQNDKNIPLSISEIDLLRQQLSSCWNAPAGAVIEKGMIVKISAKLQQNRKIYHNSVRIVDTNISKNNPFYEPITESAMRTLLNPDCIPLKLPEGKYNFWKNLTITFDYSIMKGY